MEDSSLEQEESVPLFTVKSCSEQCSPAQRPYVEVTAYDCNCSNCASDDESNNHTHPNEVPKDAQPQCDIPFICITKAEDASSKPNTCIHGVDLADCKIQVTDIDL